MPPAATDKQAAASEKSELPFSKDFLGAATVEQLVEGRKLLVEQRSSGTKLQDIKENFRSFSFASGTERDTNK